MKRYYLLFGALVASLTLSPLSAATTSKQTPSSNGQNKQPSDPASKNLPTMSKEEMDFANQLSPLHKQIFTQLFSAQLRQEAMQMMDEYADDMDEENPMTPDMAVEQTLMNHRIEMSNTDTTPAKK